MIRTTVSMGPTAHLKGMIRLILIAATLLVAGMAQASPRPAVAAAGPAAGTVLPDLVITDVWSDGSQICYQVRNIGEGASPPGHETLLLVDGQQDIDQIGLELAPGERLARCFAWQWLCTPLQDGVQVCADAYGKVAEADESNNCRKELWICDQTAPQILEGPFVSELSQTTAVLQWKTDEASDSTAQYDDQARLFGMEQSSPSLDTDHSILLTGLNPYTLYQYRVRSTDESGNTVESAPGFFETLPVEDSVPPTAGTFTVEKEEGEAVHYKFRVPASDNACLERLELYLDEELIGTAYTPARGPQVGQAGETQASGIESPVFEFDLMPGVLQMPYAEFFQEHMIWATAVDCTGGIGGGGGPWEPAPNPFDGQLTFLAPDEDDVLWIPGAVVPAGTTVNIAVRAAEFELEMCPPSPPGDCTHRPTPVERVEFYVDDVLLHTSYSAAEQYEHSYSWDVGGLGLGSHEIKARAFAADGRELGEERTMGIETGAARLSVRRTALRDAQGFLIRLLVTNLGTDSAYLEAIQDNLTGFQAINDIEAHYTVSVAYDVAHSGCDVTIATYDTIGTPYELAPDDYLVLEYRAMPILYPSMPWAFRSVDYAIGSDPLVVTRREAGASHTDTFSRPAALVECGAVRETPGDAVAAWREASSYLIVTHPSFLLAFSPAADADCLLSALADLASLKHGILGYLTGVVDRHLVDQYIEEWGATMADSDGTAGGYLGNGYLLIVGETEIVPAATVDLDPWYKASWDVGPIHLTDVYYADTHSNLIDPELMVGRIIGNNAAELSIPVVTTILLERGSAGYGFDRSDALVMSGWSMGRGGGSSEIHFWEERWDVTDYLLADGTTVTSLHTPDYDTEAGAVDRFLELVPEQDIVHMVGHGGPWHLDDLKWSDILYSSDPFGDANPFAYGSSCLTGRYAGEWRGDPIETSFAETFLHQGAAAYLGSTEKSWAPASQNIAGSIYYHWDPGRSIGSVVKEVKTARGSSGGRWDYIEDVWTVEYQIFGDPQLGEGVTPWTATEPPASAEGGGVPPTIEIEIPDYTVQQYEDGGIQVRIPGGFWVQLPGQPMVPTYDYSLHVDKGTRVQDVSLVSRSDLETATGLEIPVFDPREATPAAAGALQDLGGSEWWPDQDFDWSIKDNPDGSSDLLMQIYPFYYNPLTTDVRFYKKYTFAIESSSSLAQVGRLTTDRPAYEAGATVAIDLWIDNPGPAQDITVEAAVKALSSDQVVDGLLLRSLKGLTGPATYSLGWDSDGQAAGDYYVEANIRDAAGNILDRAIVNLTIGIAAAEMANWSVTPEWFRAGDQITIGFDVINTGTVPISGTAAIQLLEDSSVVAEFSQVILKLAPGASAHVEKVWAPPTAEAAAYTVTATVHYDSAATPPLMATVRRYRTLFVPMVCK